MSIRARFFDLQGNSTKPDGNISPFLKSHRSFQSQWRRSLIGSGIQIDKWTLANSYGLSAAAFACIGYNANAVMSVPWKIELPGGAEAPIHPFGNLLEDKLFSWKLEASENIWAVGYARKIFNRHDSPSKIEWLNPQDVQPFYATNGNRTEVIYYMVGTERVKTFPHEMIVFPQFSAQNTLSTFSDQTGLSPLEVALTEVMTDRALMDFAVSFFANNAKPEGILVSNRASEKDLARDNKTLKSMFGGTVNRWKAFFTNVEYTWLSLTTNPKDLAMSELKTITREDICAAFGVNPVLVGLGSASDPFGASSTYNSIAVNHMTNVIMPRLEGYAKVLNDEWVSVDFDKPFKLVPDFTTVPLLTPITSERVNTALPLIQEGVIKNSEIRDYFGLPVDDIGLEVSPTQPLAVWQGNMVRLNEARALTGLPPDPVDGQKFFYQQAPEIPAFGGPGLTPTPVSFATPGLLPGQDAPTPENIQSTKGLNGIQYDKYLETLRLAQLGELPVQVAIDSLLLLGIEKTAAAKAINGIIESDKPLLVPDPLSDATPPPTRAAKEALASFQVGFADNSLITTWQRMAADTWSDTGITWVHPADYHLSLVYDMDGVPLSAVKELTGIEISQPKMNINIQSFEVFDTHDDGTALVALVEPSEQLRAMQSALVIDFMAAGGVPNEFTMPGNWKPHITLAYGGSSDVPDMTMPTTLIVNNVQLEAATDNTGDYRLMRQWDLAGATPEQRKELKNWERRAAKKGAGVSFEPEHLRDHPALQFLQGELSKDDADIESIFDAGRALLEGKD